MGASQSNNSSSCRLKIDENGYLILPNLDPSDFLLESWVAQNKREVRLILEQCKSTASSDTKGIKFTFYAYFLTMKPRREPETADWEKLVRILDAAERNNKNTNKNTTTSSPVILDNSRISNNSRIKNASDINVVDKPTNASNARNARNARNETNAFKNTNYNTKNNSSGFKNNSRNTTNSNVLNVHTPNSNQASVNAKNTKISKTSQGF